MAALCGKPHHGSCGTGKLENHEDHEVLEARDIEMNEFVPRTACLCHLLSLHTYKAEPCPLVVLLSSCLHAR